MNRENHQLKCSCCQCKRFAVLVPCVLYTGLVVLAFAAPISLRSSSLRVYDEAVVLGYRSLESLHDHGSSNPPLLLDDNSLNDDPRQSQEILKNVFNRADRDHDERLTLLELSDWIDIRIREHIDQALLENEILFTAIDIKPRDGLVSWDEYHWYFLKQHGLSHQYAEKHDEKHHNLARSIKETIMRDRASWSEAARSDPERLTLGEFLAFRHPESSRATVMSLVEELLDKFDHDGDEFLTEEEFSSLPQQQLGLAAAAAADDSAGNVVEEQRRSEFRQLVDRDRDGRADRHELLMYMDPRNPRHARQEASQLLQLADTDADGAVSLMEVLAHAGPFLNSKMVDTARSFHDEF
ncbi:45 kDa calcium-binding protein isoform X1 [Schistocerca piceifrons]|uniref:45 kDa calcium-binding protein isoform X1 n=1 Tax=Schistocerca piceifrons TaxID=274613 RepID=UPI001F5FBB4F|nr:45 kDa calcium-binding protein isoform X1 [Schistocerca piceifrons]